MKVKIILMILYSINLLFSEISEGIVLLSDYQYDKAVLINIDDEIIHQWDIPGLLKSYLNPDSSLYSFSRVDNETFLIMALGGYGVVSVASNIIGNQVKSMIGLILEGEIEQASSLHKKLLPLFNALFWVTNPIPIKYALNKKGFPVGDLRLPMVMPDEILDSGVKLDEILDNYHIDVSEDY